MADVAIPAFGAPVLLTTAGRAHQAYSGLTPAPYPGLIRQDLRIVTATTGAISDVMVLKTAGGEVPFVNGRVWLLRYADGLKSWEGWTDAAGAYTATGLEAGVDYVAVGIDPTRQHKTTGAGPVTAV